MAIRGRPGGVHFKGYVSGGPQLLAQLKKLRAALTETVLVTAAEDGAEVIAEEWRGQARSRFGYGPGTTHYIDAIGVKAFPGDRGAVAYVALNKPVSVGKDEDHPSAYAPTLEFGRTDHSAKPTLRPAFDASRQRALDAVATNLRERLGKL